MKITTIATAVTTGILASAGAQTVHFGQYNGTASFGNVTGPGFYSFTDPTDVGGTATLLRAGSLLDNFSNISYDGTQFFGQYNGTGTFGNVTGPGFYSFTNPASLGSSATLLRAGSLLNNFSNISYDGTQFFGQYNGTGTFGNITGPGFYSFTNPASLGSSAIQIRNGSFFDSFSNISHDGTQFYGQYNGTGTFGNITGPGFYSFTNPASLGSSATLIRSDNFFNSFSTVASTTIPVPEPSSALLLGLGSLTLLNRRKR